MRWTLARADIRMGEGDSVTRFAADSLSGQATPRGMAGDLRGASGKIGAVPLNMSEIDGKRSEEHTSELQSLMRISYAVFCLKKKNNTNETTEINLYNTQIFQRIQTLPNAIQSSQQRSTKH